MSDSSAGDAVNAEMNGCIISRSQPNLLSATDDSDSGIQSSVSTMSNVTASNTSYTHQLHTSSPHSTRMYK